MSDSRSTKRWIILFTAIAVPAALGVETLLRLFVLPAEFEEVRVFLAPTMTTVAWVMVGLTSLGVAAGLLLQRWLVRRAVAKAQGAGEPDTTGPAGMGAFLLAASVPQAPAILAALSFLVGAELVPVLVAVMLSTAGVCYQAVRVE